MLADLPGKGAGRILFIGGAASCRYLKSPQIFQSTQIPILHDQASHQFFQVQPIACGSSEGTDVQEPKIFFPLQVGQGVLGVAGCDHHLDKGRGDFLGRRDVHRPIQCDHTSERRHRIGLAGPHVGFARVRSEGDAAGVIVLDDDRGRFLELLDQLQRGIRVQVVVVRHRLSMQGLGPGDRRLA